MKFVLLFAVFVVFVAMADSRPTEEGVVVVDDKEWEEYKTKFNKAYTDPKEDEERRELYKSSKALVTAHNKRYDAGEVSYQLGVNNFSDLKSHEKEKFHGYRRKETR